MDEAKQDRRTEEESWKWKKERRRLEQNKKEETARGGWIQVVALCICQSEP